MKYNIYRPSRSLETIVKQYFIITPSKDIEKLMFLPNGGNFMIFNKGIKCTSRLSDDKVFNIPKGFSVSLKRNKAATLFFDLKTVVDTLDFPIIVVELKPIGFYKLFNKDADKLTKHYETIDENITQKYFSKIYTHNSLDEELEYLDNSLQEMELANNNTHLLIEDIIASIINKHYLEVTVEELMTEFGYTRKTMERQFKKFIGLTPKNFIYILKFCKTFLKYVEQTKSLKDIKYRYSDNAHFNVVFQNITGHTPSELFNAVQNDKILIYQMNRGNKL